MKNRRKTELESAGWRVGDTQEFLELSATEMALVNVRVSLARDLRNRRKVKKISQATLARRIGSSQSRVAKMEAGDPSVTIDLLMKTLLNAGSTRAEIARVIGRAG